MTIKLFPTRFNLVLPADEQSSFQELWEYNPEFREEIQLLHAVIRAGIEQMIRTTEERQPSLKRTNLEANKRSTAQTAGQKALLREQAQPPFNHRHIETYIATFVGETLRQRLEDFLCERDDIDEETAYALLLDLGLQKAEEDPDAVNPDEVKSDLSRTASARQRRLIRVARLCAIASGR
jgi:hypothetical protein